MKHALVTRDGYTVPLIGVKPSAVMERCDGCRRLVKLSNITYVTVGCGRMWCKRCLKKR